MRNFFQKVVVDLSAAGRVVAVNLYLPDVLDVVGLVHLAYAAHHLLGKSGVRGVHTVLGDVDRRHQLYAIGQGVAEGDGGVGRGLAVVAHDYVEIAAVHLVDVVRAQESPFHAVKVQVGTPVVDAVTLRQCCRALALMLLTARQSRQHRQETYRPCLHFVDKGTES